MTENWYLVLELDFDPNPVNDEALIEQRIEEKRKFWSSKANDFNRGAEYRKYTQLLPSIKKDMIGEANIRAELIKDACEKTYEPIDKTLKMIRKTEIPQDTVDKMAAKLKVDVETVKRRVAALGMKVVASQGGDYQALYDKYYKTKPQNADKFNGMNALLKSFHVTNLYEFLYADTTIKNPNNLPCDALRQKAKEKKTKEFYKNDSISGSGSKLCGQCDECFKDDVSKQIYDKYLEYNARKAILDGVKEIMEISGELSQEVYSDSVGKLTELFKNRKDAEEVLAAFCKVEKIPSPVSGEEKKENPYIKICRCGCVNDTSDGRTVCKACGLALQIKCPKCGTVNNASINVCKCGFKFENLDKAVSLCDLASNYLDSMDFSAAEVHLVDAERYWPGYERIAELKERLEDLKSRVGSAVEDMRKACREKKYYEAKRQLEAVRKFSPSYSDIGLEEEIKNGIETAEKYKQIAKASQREADIADACAKAYEACHDCPGIREIIGRYPPAAATDLTVFTDSLANVNVLSWKSSPTDGLLYYSVVRKEGAIPLGVQDGTLIGRVSSCSISDSNILSGVQYYYSIFTERAGVFSGALSTKTAVQNFFEISGVHIAAGNGLLQLSWNPIANNAQVVIERTDASGKTIKFTSNGRNNYIDKDLENDKRYSYKLYLTYAVGISKTNTKGVIVDGIPTCPPMPVEELTIKAAEGNEFLMNWNNPGGGEVQFFYAKKKPEYLSGDLLPLSTLESGMNALLLKKTSESSGSFRYDGEEPIYILAANVKSASAVIGKILRVNKGGSVKIHGANSVNGKIMFNLDLPKGLTGFVVLFRHDRFPEDLSDTGTVRKYIPLKQYQYDGGLLIDSNEAKEYYFSIFAEFRRDGEADYSGGTDYYFSNVAKKTILYSISISKKLFGGGNINFSFETESNPFTLPDIDVMSAQGRAPMFKKSGTLFCQIASQEVAGSVNVSIPLPKGLARDTYLKPFLRDEGLAGKYVLKIKPGSDHQIS